MTGNYRLLQSLMRVFKARDIMYRQLRDPPRATGAMDPERFDERLGKEAWSVRDFDMLTLRPPTSPAAAQRPCRHVFFLHGGAYILEASILHRRILEILALEQGLAVTFVDYPKAPEHGFRTTHEVVLEAYAEAARRNPDDEPCLFGDSAGGGLALSLLQVLRRQADLPFPARTVLASPWLDISMGNARVPEYERLDPALSVEALVFAGEAWARGEDPRNPLLSPLFGELSGLGRILLLFGTREIFYPDCLDFLERARDAEGTSIEARIGEGMQHDWILTPVGEGRRAVDEIARFLAD